MEKVRVRGYVKDVTSKKTIDLENASYNDKKKTILQIYNRIKREQGNAVGNEFLDMFLAGFDLPLMSNVVIKISHSYGKIRKVCAYYYNATHTNFFMHHPGSFCFDVSKVKKKLKEYEDSW